LFYNTPVPLLPILCFPRRLFNPLFLLGLLQVTFFFSFGSIVSTSFFLFLFDFWVFFPPLPRSSHAISHVPPPLYSLYFPLPFYSGSRYTFMVSPSLARGSLLPSLPFFPPKFLCCSVLPTDTCLPPIPFYPSLFSKTQSVFQDGTVGSAPQPSSLSFSLLPSLCFSLTAFFVHSRCPPPHFLAPKISAPFPSTLLYVPPLGFGPLSVPAFFCPPVQCQQLVVQPLFLVFH